MTGVVVARFGDILELRRDPVDLVPGNKYRRIGIYSWGKGMLHRPPAGVEEMGSLRYFRFPSHALIVSNIQAWEGAVALSTSAEAAEYVCSNRFLPYVTASPDVDIRYAWHFFRSEQGLATLRAASPGTQVRNRTLNRSLLEASTMPVPSLTAQRRIVARLDRLEGAVRGHHLAHQRFSPAWRALIEKLVGSPSRAPRVQLREILQTKPSESVEPERTYSIAGVYSFGRGLLSRERLAGASTKYKYFTRLDARDVVYSKLGAFEGAVAVVDDSDAGQYVSPEFPVFTTSPSVEPDYLRYCFIADSFVAQLGAATAGVGARQKRVSPTAFLALNIPLPERCEQQRLAATLGRMTSALRLSERAGALADALLPAARNEIFSAMR